MKFKPLTLQQISGSQRIVLASYGTVADFPASDNRRLEMIVDMKEGTTHYEVTAARINSDGRQPYNFRRAYRDLSDAVKAYNDPGSESHPWQ